MSEKIAVPKDLKMVNYINKYTKVMNKYKEVTTI